MTDTIKPPLRESLEVVYEDERRETIIIKRLSNTDMIKWADTGLDKAYGRMNAPFWIAEPGRFVPADVPLPAIPLLTNTSQAPGGTARRSR